MEQWQEAKLPLEMGWKEALKIYGYRLKKFLIVTLVSLIVCGILGLLVIYLHRLFS